MTVHLVGAGPGDPGLLTVRGAAVLRGAEVVVHDRLAEASLLDLAPAAAERIDVGKRPGAPVDQEEINRILVERAAAGLRVVRLKGGDPFVFGRGGEEAAALAAAGIPFEVVPGITSAVAAPAYAGIPLTYRGLSTSFTVVTGHSRHDPDRITDWGALARAGDTIVVLMGVAHRRDIADQLMAGGLAPSTPVAAVTWGTRPDQRTVRCALGDVGEVEVDPPAVIVIGAVAGLDLSWFEARPLFGRRIVVTRAEAQASSLAQRLRDLGADVVVLPVIDIVDPSDAGAALRDAARRASTYDWIIFTSSNAVDRFVASLRDARDLGSARVAAIGPGTAAALARWHIAADLMPDRSVAEGLLDSLPEVPSRALIPRAASAREVLPERLRARGWTVDVVEAYRTVPADLAPEALADASAAHAICFTSGSTVHAYAATGAPVPPVVACIGAVTADAARDCGIDVTTVAATPTLDALTASVSAALTAALA